MPVVVGALAASPEIYALGLGVTLDEIGPAWLKAIQNPITAVRVNGGACQEVVITGEALKNPGGVSAALPVPISTPGFDAAPYLCATLCVTKDPGRACATWAPIAATESDESPGCAHGIAAGRAAATPIGSNIRKLKKPCASPS